MGMHGTLSGSKICHSKQLLGTVAAQCPVARVQECRQLSTSCSGALLLWLLRTGGGKGSASLLHKRSQDLQQLHTILLASLLRL